MESDYLNAWGDGEFENTVAAALIACYETKVKKNRGAAPADRLTEERVALFRNSGPYIPAPTRIIVGPNEEDETGAFDMDNDPLPHLGCIAAPWGIQAGSYLAAAYVRRSKALGKYWVKQGPGTIFEMITIDATNNGIDGERRFFTVSKKGVVMACTQRIPSVLHCNAGNPEKLIEPDKDWKVRTATWGSFVLQSLADRRFCWSITAQEKFAKAHLGCEKEEIKSLLYARSLPMTATGRKRPILHLVESHRRRMQSGTEVDITSFLRGAQTVELGGTLFTVRAPEVLKPELSAPSVRRYYEKVLA